MSHSDSRPTLLFLCHPLTGHLLPVIRIAAALHDRGWTVAFLGSTSSRSRIEASGAEFFPLQGNADLDDAKLFDRDASVPPPETPVTAVPSIIDTRHQTIEAVPAAWESFKSTLAELHERNAGRRVFVVCEAFFYGFMPLKYGALLPPGVKQPRSVCVSITPPAIRSPDVPPFGFPDLFDPSAQGRDRSSLLWRQWEDQAMPVTQLLDQKLIEAGAKSRTRDVFMSGVNYTCHNAILQVGLPELEYPRRLFPQGFKFVGILPPLSALPRPGFDWWDDLVANARLDPADPARRKIVVVSQGTVETDPRQLILPTISWLRTRGHVMTIAILGLEESALEALRRDSSSPENAKLVGYLQYDAILPFANIWIHNGGYGAVTHGIAHGVPMVVAGEGQDKPENAKRVAWSGLGINLGCAGPEIADLGRAIDEVLSEKKYAEVAGRMKRAAEGMDCVGLIEEGILAVAEDPFWRYLGDNSE